MLNVIIKGYKMGTWSWWGFLGIAVLIVGLGKVLHLWRKSRK
jgi:hypothetical protein